MSGREPREDWRAWLDESKKRSSLAKKNREQGNDGIGGESAASAAPAAPGWYPDPDRPGMSRWFDGTEWSNRWQPGRKDGPLAGWIAPRTLVFVLAGVLLFAGFGYLSEPIRAQQQTSSGTVFCGTAFSPNEETIRMGLIRDSTVAYSEVLGINLNHRLYHTKSVMQQCEENIAKRRAVGWPIFLAGWASLAAFIYLTARARSYGREYGLKGTS